jgi:hypothetical protein
MNKEQMNQIIEAVGQEYTKWFYDNAIPSVSGKPILNGEGILTRGEFINKCKTNPEFSEKWGLKIEERELSLEERYHLWFNNNYETGMERYFHSNNIPNFDNQYYTPTPTKLITITYNNETIKML